ncbi:beta-ketoacyl synthase N-terminal-like domain-containing protein [Nonomuraea bangladeshensis]|uniref:Beta-ketoacyl synthase N-terminal-like domain-containing protein n=1 Tax=Nonomuraea bangladeshensis TaxID=404385 RepID=A0ABV3HAJ4_9ACTN
MDVPDESEIRTFLIERLGGQVDPGRPLEEHGLSSREAVAVAGELGELLGRELSPTIVWEHPTIDRLARALSAPQETAEAGGTAGEPVAVIGVGCRFPGAHGPEAYWKLLVDGRDAVGEVPEGRWEAFDDGSARTREALAGVTRHGGFLADVAGFDAGFFGISPGEAAAMDPQQRLLLETVWEALEHAGHAPRTLSGSRTGVYAGLSGTEYAHLTGADLAAVDAWTATGAALSIAANRVSYLLDLRGPSLAVDTACSSSLVATHLAVTGLRAGECDLALAAGVNLLLSPLVTVAFDRGGGTAADGRCKAFDAAADGMVRAEGCGVVVLKRLADAVRDGDRVLAVIRESAVGQDGRSNGLVAPNPEAQESLLRQVYGRLGRGPDYIEAHGTGTLLGDPIEARAIAAAVPTPVLLGSVKTNLGHLEAAAGVAGLIKAVLALHHGVIPPSLHFREPNPHIPWERLRVVTAPTPWPRREGGDPARAGVSAFGFGGTNAHVALDAFPAPHLGTPAARAKHVFLLTDATPRRVERHARVLASWQPPADLADVAHTLARRAGRGRVAAAVVAGDAGELAAKLREVRPVGPVTAADGPVWVFSGYSPHRPSLELYAAEPAYRRTLDLLAPMLRDEAGIDVHDPGAAGVATLQPIIFAAQLALAETWRAYGFEPAAVIGHSMGEVAAAVVAGGLGVEDGVRVICARARLLGGLGGGGAMAVVETGAEEVPDDLHVAVYASPSQTVVTGEPERVAEFAASVAARGLFARTLTAEGAGHSPQVRSLVPLLREELRGIAGGKPDIPYYSPVFEDPREAPAFEGAYWAAGLRRPVRLMQAVRAAAEDGHTLFTELGPRPLLSGALRDTLPATARVTEGPFHDQLAAVAVAVPPRTRGRLADVPHSPWEHVRHWAEPKRPPAGHPLLGAHVETPSCHLWTTTLDDLADAPWRLPPEEWHRDGHPVLTPAVLARLARAAVAETSGGMELRQVTLHAHLPLPAQVTLTLADGRVELSAKNAAGRWTVHGSAVSGPAAGAAELIDLLPGPVPVTLDAKLLARAWVSVPPPEAGMSRPWLILAEEGDARAARLRALLPTPSGEGAPAGGGVLLGDGSLRGEEALPGDGVLVLVPPGLGVAGVQRVMLRVAELARRGARIVIATERAQAVRDGDLADPGPAALRALVRVLALEHPETRARLVDHDDLDALVRELSCDAEDDEVAWRAGARYAARLRRVTLPLSRGPVAGPGAYVITGGHGHLGRLTARLLLERGATRVVLNSRTPHPDAGLVRTVAGDLAAPGTAERLVAAATEGGLRLRGVVHAAGVLDDRLIADLEPDGLARVWAAKVVGAQRLHDATKDLDLDWWVAFSSAASLLGSPGQAAYAAANAWLDALCERRRAEGLPALAVNWGPWAGTAAPATPGVEPLTEDEGLEALEALLQRDFPAGVVKLDPARAVALFPSLVRIPYFSEVAEAPALEDLSGPVGVSHKLRERAAAVLGVEPSRLGDDVVLTDLGLDSLAATRLRGMIEHDFGVRVAAAPLLNGGTLGALARAVTESLGLAVVEPRDAAERQVTRVLAGLLGREPSVTEPLPPGILPEALALLAGNLSQGPSQALGQDLAWDPGQEVVTSADLAVAIRRVDEAEAGRGVVRPLTPAAVGGAPIFLAHPAGGTTGVYALLAARLPVPVLGLERLDQPDDIPGRAARYAEVVRRAAEPPYRLGGWSFGGILAFEIARLLGEDDVELLAMIDSGLPDEVGEPDRRRLAARRYAAFAAYLTRTYGTPIHLDRAELETLDEPAQFALIEARIAESGVLATLPPAILRHQLTSHDDTRAIERYRPAGPYHGRAVLYRSTEPAPWTVEDPRYAHADDPARGFAPYAPRLEVVEIPGSHHLNLLDPPHVEVIAEHLKGLLL